MKKLMIAALVGSLAGSMTAAAQSPSAAAAPPAADAAGTWNANFKTANGEIPAQIKLAKSGEKLTGTISSQMGESKLEAEQKGKAVTLWFTMQGQNGPLAIELSATQDGDTLTGTTMAAGSPAGEWTATRDKAAASAAPAAPASAATSTSTAAPASLTGTWNVSLELPNINATPTLVLKQDGEKLTGEYISQQYGKFPLTGTVKGSDVTITFAMNVEGTALNVTYAGKIDKDGTIAGTANLGDMMNGTFAATRQK
ncbi:MAG TPA: hypothetical protein VFK57_06165 [Vicinamibacterales bacterium]|nr:hypothetical protein [Vicinamibacterales bacterium]